MTTSELTAPPEEAAASRSKTSGAGLLKWFWPEILGSVKGQLAETLDSGQSFGCRPMTLSGLKSVDQQIRPPLAAPNAVFSYQLVTAPWCLVGQYRAMACNVPPTTPSER
jgi:hypothetical protein